MLDFRHGNNREEFREQEVTGKEQTKCSQVETYLPYCGPVISTPATRQIIAINGGNNDHKPFEPHTDIYNHRHKEGNCQVPAQFAEPEDLRRKHITTHHQVIAPSERTEHIHAVLHKGPSFILVHAVPCHKQFGE